jgi:hypothetical protein
VSAATPLGNKLRLQERWRRFSVALDFALGLLAALAALHLVGLAIVAVVALPLVAGCTLSLGIERLRSRRG